MAHCDDDAVGTDDRVGPGKLWLDISVSLPAEIGGKAGAGLAVNANEFSTMAGGHARAEIKQPFQRLRHGRPP